MTYKKSELGKAMATVLREKHVEMPYRQSIAYSPDSKKEKPQYTHTYIHTYIYIYIYIFAIENQTMDEMTRDRIGTGGMGFPQRKRKKMRSPRMAQGMQSPEDTRGDFFYCPQSSSRWDLTTDR
jgi:hypothetical protein